jgi:hypothetical protein
MDHTPEDETVVETTTFTRTVSHGRALANGRRALDSARQTAQALGLEFIVGLAEDLQAAQTGDDAAAADALTRVVATVTDAGTQITTLTAELAAALGQAVTQSMVDKATALGTALGNIDPAAVVTPPPPPPPVFVQGTNADGTPMVDPVTGAPVDQNGNPDPGAGTIQGGTPA